MLGYKFIFFELNKENKDWVYKLRQYHKMVCHIKGLFWKFLEYFEFYF